MFDRTKNDREFARQLIEGARNLKPDDHEAMTFIAARLATTGGAGLLIRFETTKHGQFQGNEMALHSLARGGFIVHLSGNRYGISPKLYDAVDNDFMLSTKEGWAAVEINLPYLVFAITERFNHDEIDSLCFDLMINKDEIGDRSTPISERIERLVKLMVQNGRFDRLAQALEMKRPGAISWLNLFLA